MNTFQAAQDITKLTALARQSGLLDPSLSPVVSAITAAGSNRRYYRLRLSDGDVIGTVGDDVDENKTFIAMARHFTSLALPVPKVVAVSDDFTSYIQTDAGSQSLYALLDSANRERAFEIAVKIMAALPGIQFRGAENFDWNLCHPTPVMDRTTIMWDLNYFKYDFLKLVGVPVNEMALEREFQRLADVLTSTDMPIAFQLRDFQTRNIMLDDKDRWSVIDFQGGRRGASIYDVASFVWQTRARFSSHERARLVDAYYRALNSWSDITSDRFSELLGRMVLFRRLQTLGAYGLRGLMERKPQFMGQIKGTIDGILADEFSLLDDYPTIRKSLIDAGAIVVSQNSGGDSEALAPRESSRLTVKVSSFSYKKGYPLDRSGNGGGFVFDCRALANPGRYDEYKLLNARDAAVIEFLSRHNECEPFVERALAIVSPSIERYIERGFTNLEVAFGCTGGQHRSMRCADLLAARVSSQYPMVNVSLCHREQNINEFYEGQL